MPNRTGYVFAGEDDEPYLDIKRSFHTPRAARLESKISGSMSLRHTYASHMAMRGVRDAATNGTDGPQEPFYGAALQSPCTGCNGGRGQAAG